MKYFIPEWDDRIDPNYNFLSDEHSEKHNENPTKNDYYMWDLFGVDNVPFDGVLVSRMKLEENKNKLEYITKYGIHKFLHLPNNFPIIGDCGAWGYINQEKPPFNTEELLEYYLKSGFNFAVSIDHLITPSVYKINDIIKQKRWDITIEKAIEFYDFWNNNNNYKKSFIPIGVVQGWDKESYLLGLKELLKVGYKYIGVGGIARTPSNKLLEIINEIHSFLKTLTKKPNIHLFGIARPDILSQLKNLGVTSFDSASFLRRAWLGMSNNYFSFDGKQYGAIRIPQADRSPRAKKIIEEKKIDFQNLQKLEQECLKLMRDYDNNKTDIDTVLNKILEYDILLGEGRDNGHHIRKTLQDKPWQKCPCKICKEIGVETIIFRGNNRNRRRGFHNTVFFYDKLIKINQLNQVG